MDLTTIDLSCLTESSECDLSNTAEDATIKNIVACLISKYCILRDSVSTIEDRISSLPTTTGEVRRLTIKVNTLSCIQDITASNLNANDFSDSELIQVIADGLCKTWGELQTNLSDIYQRFDTLPTGGSGGGYTPPVLSSNCLWLGTKTITDAWNTFDADYCALVTKLGSTSSINSAAIEGVSCYPTINNFLLNTGDPTDQIVSDGTLATSHSNLWKTMCALVTKVQSMNTILSSCCGFSCKKFEVLANAVNFDATNNTVDVRLSFDGSTNLPDPPYTFTDEGSLITFTDNTGYSLPAFPFKIESGEPTTLTFDLTGLDFTNEIQIDLDLQFQVEDQEVGSIFHCTKCLHTYFKTNIGCAFCELNIAFEDVTGDGVDAEVVITYTMPGPPETTNVITVTQTGKYIIPAQATIVSIINVSNSLFTITHEGCPNLVIPEVQTLACYSFIIDNDFFDGQNLSSLLYFYDIMGYSVDGIDYTYGSPVRCDLSQYRTIMVPGYQGYTNVIDEDTGTCKFAVLSPTSYSDYYQHVNTLSNLPANPIIFELVKTCVKITTGTNDIFYTNLIVKAISGKKIFLRLQAVADNETNTSLNNRPEVYIKGVEIPQGTDCDCCAVYDGS